MYSSSAACAFLRACAAYLCVLIEVGRPRRAGVKSRQAPGRRPPREIMCVQTAMLRWQRGVLGKSERSAQAHEAQVQVGGIGII